jgi:hypothetical protein
MYPPPLRILEYRELIVQTRERRGIRHPFVEGLYAFRIHSLSPRMRVLLSFYGVLGSSLHALNSLRSCRVVSRECLLPFCDVLNHLT